jgi:hypothetical protein
MQRNQGSRDWSLPSLMVGVEVTEVLPPRLEMTQEQRDRLEATPEFVDIQAFVDRRVQRRSVDPMADPTQIDDIVIVNGPPLSGKTAMLLWFLEGAPGARMPSSTSISSASSGPDFSRRSSTSSRWRPNPPSDLRQRSRRLQSCSPIDRDRPRRPAGRSRTPDNPIESLFTAFRAALVQAAQGKPLIVALDHIGSMDADAFRNYLTPLSLRARRAAADAARPRGALVHRR